MTAKSPVIFIFSKRGEAVAARLKARFDDATLYALEGRATGDVPFVSASDEMVALFKAGYPIIGLCASGILVRLLGGHLQSKWQEPPVVAMAEDGSAVVPLLGGHHGANDLAREIARLLDTVPAITTSGDIHYGIALDEPPSGFVLSNPECAKEFMAQLLQGERVRLLGDAPWLVESALPFDQDGHLTIEVTNEPRDGAGDHLVYHPKNLALGMGSERGAASSDAIELAERALNQGGFSRHSLAAVVSLDLKSDEAALHAVANHFGVPAWFYDATVLSTFEDQLKNPSEIVKAEVGVAGVAEGAALAATRGGRLVVEKIKSQSATAAIAELADGTSLQTGAPRGRVFLVGVGPGTSQWRSGECSDLLKKATDWVGYDLYLDLVQDLKTNQKEHRFPLGAEEKRVRHALELAGEGRDVAVVCSGDPGIFAMATLAYELIDTGAAEGPVSPAAKRAEVIVAPGISAFQAAAARAGAPIGHDFCCISLSDLLTPRDDILKRLKAAAEGDFVIAFYNPRSKRRVTLLDEAFDILRKHRPVDTPVVLATDLGRPAEHVRVFTLDTVNSEEVDMLTLVMVGSSHSKAVTTGDGKTWVYTPRGYDRKEIT